MKATFDALRLVRCWALVLAIGLPSVAPSVVAGGPPPAQVPLTIDGLPFEYFGTAVAIDGDTAVVTTPLGNVDGNDGYGAAYVYVREGSGWTQQARLSAQDPEAYSNFGRSAAIDGDTVVIGASNADGVVDASGAVYVFVRSGSSWTQQAKVTAADGEGFSDFGLAVDLDGDSVVVGSPSLFINGENVVGAAYVFVRNGSTWTQQQKLVASDGLAFDSFGNAVALDGDSIVVAASQASVDPVFFSGAAYAFARSGGVWTQTQKLIAADAADEDGFGSSLSLHGTDLIIGARQAAFFNEGGPGAAYVFTQAGGSWTQQARLAPTDGVLGDQFGSSVAIEGDVAIVGSPFSGYIAGVDLEAGALYAFARVGSDWSQQARIRAVGARQGEHLGVRASLSGSTTVVGAPDAPVGDDPSQGKAYIFALGTPQLSVTPAAIDFGDVVVGESSSRVLTVSNLGTADLFSGQLVLIGTDAAQFAILEDGCNGQRIAPAASCRVEVGFLPSALAPYTAQVVAPGSAGVAFINLSGQGVPAAPRIAVTPSPLAQSVPQRELASQSITISHPGDSQNLQWQVTQVARANASRLQVLGDATDVSTMQPLHRVDRAGFLRAPGTRVVRPAGLPPIGQSLTHSASDTLVQGNSIACGDNTTGFTNANQFLRTFTLADFGVSDTFAVTSVNVGIENLTVAMPLTVNLYTLQGDLSYFNMDLLATTSVILQPLALSIVNVPIAVDVPPGATLVLEIANPSLDALAGQFTPGSNAVGQTAPSFAAAAECGADDPTDLADLGFPDMHLVMSVTGSSAAPPVDCALPSWLDLPVAAGTIAPAGSQTVTLTFDAATLAVGDYTANLCVASNADDALVIVPVTLSVTPGVELPPLIFADGFESGIE